MIHDGGKEEHFFVTGGFMEVQPTTVTILADAATRASDLDEAAAEEARQQALKAFNEKSSELRIIPVLPLNLPKPLHSCERFSGFSQKGG